MMVVQSIFRSTSQMLRQIAAGELSASEATERSIRRILRYDGEVNAVVVRDFDRARRHAAAADARRRKREPLGPLHGLPMTVKESFQVEGLTTSWGALAEKTNMAPQDALAVARLKDAGAIVLGKTNVPLMLQEYQTFNAIYGTTLNPYDRARTPGGSSGGGAAAVAAGLSALDFGSDLAGSLRVPASFCGVYAHKPSFGVVPTVGHSLRPSLGIPDLSVVGPIARSAEDLALALDVTAGPTPAEGRGWTLNLPPSGHRVVRNLRIGVLRDSDISPVADDVARSFDKLLKWLSTEGASVEEIALPMSHAAHEHIFQSLVRAVVAGRLGEAAFAALLEKVATFPDADASLDAVRLRGLTMRHWDWAQADRRRLEMRAFWAGIFERYDFVLIPGTPHAATAIDERPAASRDSLKIRGRDVSYGAQSFWQGLATVGALPATVAPIGQTEGGLPVAVQIIGPYLKDHSTIWFAQFLEANYYAFVPPIGF